MEGHRLYRERKSDIDNQVNVPKDYLTLVLKMKGNKEFIEPVITIGMVQGWFTPRNI